MVSEPTVQGRHLRHVRTLSGLTLSRLASLATFNVGYLSRVEREERPVSDAVVDAYARALGMNRRQLLAAMGLLFVEGPSLDLAERLARVQRGGSVDMALVDGLAATLAGYRRQEDADGGAALWTAVRDHLGTISAMLPLAPNAVVDELLTLAAEHAHWLSWVAHTQGRTGPALRWLDVASGWATDAGSTDAVAWLGRVRSFYALRRGDVARAGRAAELARSMVEYANPATRSIVNHAAAMAAATAGDTDQAQRLADVAILSAAKVPDEADRPPWLYWLTPARALLNRGDVAYQVGDFTTAADIYEAGLLALTDMPRDRAFYAARLSDAQARA